MKILFYNEPNIQLNNPNLAANWIEIGVTNLANAFMMRLWQCVIRPYL